MPITNSVHLGKRGGLDRYEFTTNTGEVRKEYRVKHNVGVDPVAWMNDIRVPALDIQLAQEEIGEALEKAERGENPDKVPPDHQTQADFDRRLIAALMQNTSIETTIAALPFWTAHQASARSGNNNVQRAATLGVPTAEYAEADSRFGVAQGIAGGVNTWKSETWAQPPSGSWD
jgi:hypothetical protein